MTDSLTERISVDDPRYLYLRQHEELEQEVYESGKLDNITGFLDGTDFGGKRVDGQDGARNGLEGDGWKDEGTKKREFELSPEQVEHFRDAYNIFDKDGDGGVTVHELAHVMRCLGQDPTDEEVRRMFNEVDQDGSGEIDFEEFLEIMKNQMMANMSEEEANKQIGPKEFTRENWMMAFKVFDLDGDGLISPAELGQVLKNMGEELKEFELKEMIQEVDRDGDGKIDIDDFIKVMVHGIQI